MGTVSFLVKGGGRHEFSCKRLERMLGAACRNFGSKFGLEDSGVAVWDEGPISSNGGTGPLELTVCFSDDILDKLAPKIDPEEESSSRSDTELRRFVRAMGETAVRLGPENGWPPRHVRATVSGVDISWSG